MNRCQKCQAELPKGARYCAKCGSAQIFSPQPSSAPESTKPETPKTMAAQPSALDELAKLLIQSKASQAVSPVSTSQPSSSRADTRSSSGPETAKRRPAPEALKFNGQDVASKLPKQPDSSQKESSQGLSKPSGQPAVLKTQIWPDSSKPTTLPDSPKPMVRPALPKPTATQTNAPKKVAKAKTDGEQFAASSSKLTEKPAGGVRDMSQQVTRKDATVPTQQLWSGTFAADVPTLQRGAIVRTSTLPPQRKFSAEELPIELEDLPAEEVPTGHVPAGFGRNAESLAATSKVAEHWRNSWRERQRAEAGPAVEVSRGQASVPMPLMAMQHSIARMRAVILNNKQAKQGRTNFTFWLTLLLMVCLIGGLGAYVLSTYMFNSPFGVAHVVTPAEAAEPTLTLQGPQTGSFTQNSTLHLHGEHFGRGDTIALLLDTISPLLSVQANAKGTFDVSLHIGSDWSVGAHLISAQDTRTNQIAYMNIEVSPQATPETTSPNLSLSKQQLTFSAVSGESNPSGQQVTLTNTSGQALQWSVMAVVDNNLSWLILDSGHLRGTLDVSGKDSINVSIITAGLAGSSKPYSGQILFTINGKEQLMLPIQLYIHDPSIEVVVNPNLIIAQLAPGGACKPTTLTLINLSNRFISWSATPYAPDQAHIHLNNKPAEQGQLQPTGTPGDTEVLALTCINVHLGEQLYHITVYYDNVPQDIPVSIRP